MLLEESIEISRLVWGDRDSDSVMCHDKLVGNCGTPADSESESFDVSIESISCNCFSVRAFRNFGSSYIYGSLLPCFLGPMALAAFLSKGLRDVGRRCPAWGINATNGKKSMSQE